MVANYPVSQTQTKYNIFSVAIPSGFSDGTNKTINVSIPVGFTMSGAKNSPSDVYMISNFTVPTSVLVYKNGTLLTTLTSTSSSYGVMSTSYGSVNSKSVQGIVATTFSFYTYFYTINFSFIPPVASSTDTYIFYSPITYSLTCNFPAAEILPSSYGIMLNNSSGVLSSFTNANYYGSHDEAGIVLYSYSVTDNYTPSSVNKNGYCNLAIGFFNSIKCYSNAIFNNVTINGNTIFNSTSSSIATDYLTYMWLPRAVLRQLNRPNPNP